MAKAKKELSGVVEIDKNNVKAICGKKWPRSLRTFKSAINFIVEDWLQKNTSKKVEVTTK